MLSEVTVYKFSLNLVYFCLILSKFVYNCIVKLKFRLFLCISRTLCEEVKTFISKVTQIKLNSKVDLFCSKYKYTGKFYLLIEIFNEYFVG